MTDRFGKPAKLIDCRSPGPDAELFVVEGDSAANAVAAVRDETTQAVLPIQGKLLNVVNASAAKVRKNSFCGALMDALGWDEENQRAADPTRYGQVVLLADPDVDGMHVRVLLRLFFERCFPRFVSEHRLITAKPPVFRVDLAPPHPPRAAFDHGEMEAIIRKLKREGIQVVGKTRCHSLGQIDAATIEHYAVNPRTREQRVLGSKANEDPIESFKRMQAALRNSVRDTWGGR